MTIATQALNQAFPPLQARVLTTVFNFASRAYKTADKTYNASVVLTADTDIILNLTGGKTYAIHGVFPLSIANAAHGVQFDFNGGTATATNFTGRMWFGGVADKHLAASATALNTALSGGTTNAWTFAVFEGTIEVLVGGSFIVEHCQAASGASNSVVQRGSYVSATPFA